MPPSLSWYLSMKLSPVREGAHFDWATGGSRKNLAGR